MHAGSRAAGTDHRAPCGTDELEEQLAKRLAEVRAERDELAVAERVLERVSERSVVGLRAEDGGVLPGLRSEPQEGTGNAQSAGDSFDSCQRGDSCGAAGDLADALGFERARFGDPVEGDLRVVGHREHRGEVPLAQGPGP